MMADVVFPYPGGKSRFASWILDQVPAHTCFVEVFGGAAGVLAERLPERRGTSIPAAPLYERWCELSRINTFPQSPIGNRHQGRK